jgi:hypothetical protein
MHLFPQVEILPRPPSRLWNLGFRFTTQFRPADRLPYVGFRRLASAAKNTDIGCERIRSFRLVLSPAIRSPRLERLSGVKLRFAPGDQKVASESLHQLGAPLPENETLPTCSRSAA